MNWRGRYYDGLSARRHDIDLTIEEYGLSIGLAGGDRLTWSFSDIRVEASAAPGTTRLHNAAQPDASLEIDESSFIRSLLIAYPELDSKRSYLRTNRRSILLTVGACLTLAAFIYLIVTYAPRIVAPLIPNSVQQSIGDNALREIIAVFGTLEVSNARFCDAPAGQAALDRLVSRLAGTKHGEIFQARVANLKMVNALAVPGGRILATMGIVDFVGSPEEFAGAIAHEMGHAIHRHPSQAVIREIGLRATLDLLLGAGLAGGTAGILLRTSYSRTAEREADESGMSLLRQANISTAGLVRLFERLDSKNPDGPEALQIFSTHPRSADRAKRLAEAGAGVGVGTAAMSDTDWQALRKICDQG